MSAQVTTPNGHTPAAPAAQTWTEAPASATLRVVTPTGYEVLLTTRAGRMADLLTQLTTLESWLVDHQWQAAPTSKGNGKASQGDAANSVQTEPAPTCDRCGQPMKRRTTKDGSRAFWSCATKYGDGSWCQGKPTKDGQP